MQIIFYRFTKQDISLKFAYRMEFPHFQYENTARIMQNRFMNCYWFIVLINMGRLGYIFRYVIVVSNTVSS